MLYMQVFTDGAHDEEEDKVSISILFILIICKSFSTVLHRRNCCGSDVS